MMMTSDKKNPAGHAVQDARGTDPLAQYVAAVQANPPEMSAQLRARILADAHSSTAPLPRPRRAFGTWQRWFSGWAVPGLAGGVVMALTGFWVGVSVPIPVFALDAPPPWIQGALSYMDLMAVPLIGLDDPLLMEF
jgi:hypothetical protein